MSLDVYLKSKIRSAKSGSGIFVRENGAMREVSDQEWAEKNPGIAPVRFNDDLESDEVYWANITHNLIAMADAAGIYEPLWRPDEIGISKASQLIEPLSAGLEKLKADPVGFEKYNSANGWGLYKNFVPFVENYLLACVENPDAEVSVIR